MVAATTKGSAAEAATARLVEALRDPACHAPAARASRPIRVVETHVSYILLTGERAYKLKKPLRLDFLDFSTLAQRRRFCEEELRLNRRTAPELYLRVVPITGSVEAPRVDGPGEAIEWAVEMRQFDPDSLFATRLERGEIDGGLVDALAERVARFHASLASETPARAPGGDASDPSPAAAMIRSNLAQLFALDPPAPVRARLEPVARWLEAELVGRGPELADRERAGFVRDGHGDLHLSNVAVVDGQPVLFDCLEFDARLRRIDVIDEIAFGFMDFLALGRPDLGHRFVDAYLATTGDYEGASALRLFTVHRALVRTKVALIRLAQARAEAKSLAAIEHDLERHLAVAQQVAAPAAPRLVITCGLAGTGKTTVSSALVESLPALRLRSDVERKRLAGLAAAERSGSPIGGGLYASEESARTYQRLEQLAERLLASGLSVVVDAAFLARADRERFRAMARARGVAFTTVLCEAPVAVLRARIAARTARGRDASEADGAVLDHQLARYEAPRPDEEPDLVVVPTDRPIAEVEASARAIAGKSLGGPR